MDQTHKSLITEILPNTKRTLERKQRQKEEEEKKKREQDQQQQQQEEMKKKQLEQSLRQQQRQKQEEERRKEEERRSQEELQQINTLKGEFGNMINDLKSDASKLDYTISGLDLRPAQIRILVKVAETNATLKGLSMSRKRIQDEQGGEIIRSLEKNMVLERIELEGNNLGAQTVASLALLLEQNKSLRVVDLENNCLIANDIDEKQDKFEIKRPSFESFCKSISKNETLLQLNLCNCKLDNICGGLLANAMENNFTIISLDITENPNLNLYDVRRIQDYLQRNKKAYDDERYREFMERKRISKEDQTSTIQLQEKEKKEIAQDGIESRMNARRLELETQWREELEREQKIKEKTIHNLMKQAKLAGKKGKKGGGKKKK